MYFFLNYEVYDQKKTNFLNLKILNFYQNILMLLKIRTFVLKHLIIFARLNSCIFLQVVIKIYFTKIVELVLLFKQFKFRIHFALHANSSVLLVQFKISQV